jgi:hypothetical protein
MKATLKNLSERLVELGVLPPDSGGIHISNLPVNLAKALRRFGRGCLMIVTDVTLPLTGLKTLRIEIRENQKIEVTYVLSCHN